jgi:drug/metabolite transporter (DMT)-like permease
VLFILLRVQGPLVLPARKDRWRVVLLGILGNLIYQFFFIVGLDLTTAGNASLLLATTPAWTLLLSVGMKHERPSYLVWLGVLGTVIGMGLVVGGGLGSSAPSGNLRGDLLIVGGAISWALHTVGAKSLVERYGALPVTAWTLWVGTLALLIWGAPTLLDTPLRTLSLATWLGIAYAGVFGISIAYALWYRGVQLIGNARTAAYQNLVPVVALLVAWVWLEEVPRALQIAGAGVILLGVSAARLGKDRPVEARPEPRTSG